MTSMERLRARLAGQPVDKHPNMNIAMALVAKNAGASYRAYAQDYRKLVEGNLRCVERYGFDTVSAISDPMREASGYGATLVFPEEGVPYSPIPLLRDGLDPSLLHRFDVYQSERTLDRIRAVEAFKQAVGDEVPIIGWVEGVLAETADLRGVNGLMIDLAEEEDGLEAVMEEILAQQCRFAKAQVDAGAHIIGVGNAVASLVGPTLYARYCQDLDRRLIEYIQGCGALVKLHICGNIQPILPQLAQIGPDILDIDWMVNFALAVDTCRGTKTCVCGNLDPVAVLMQGTPQQVEEKLRLCMAAGDETTLYAAGCEVPVSTPEENLLAMDRALFA